jgi:hypothetical protein
LPAARFIIPGSAQARFDPPSAASAASAAAEQIAVVRLVDRTMHCEAADFIFSPE